MKHSLALFAAALASAAALSAAPERPPAGGDALIRRHCVACHSPDYLTTQPPHMGAAFWTAEVAKMRTVYGAAIPDDAAAAIAAELAATR